MKKVTFALKIALLFFISQPLLAGETLIVGIWDQHIEYGQTESDDWSLKVIDYVLPVFEKRDSEWKVVERVLENPEWTITFDGRSLGSCKSKAFANSQFEFKNVLQPVGKVAHPDTPKKPSLDQHAYRALVLVSKPNFHDPDEWKKSKLPDSALKKVKLAFHKKYPTADNCEKFEFDSRPHPEKFADGDIKIKTIYGSKRGAFLIELALEKWGCDPIFDAPFDTQWFGINALGQETYMSQRLKLIDAGDYDNDGHSELVFEDASEGGDDDNSRGYSIWSHDFKLLAKRVWSLH